MRIGHLVPAEPGWKAVFKEPDGGESQSRILAWAVSDDGDTDDGTGMFGVIVDPSAPSRIVRAADAVPPSGATFNRYRYVAPEPLVVRAPAPAPESDDTAERLAKGLLKRKR
ncbi:MAG TPA: hypothetical protein VJ986_00735 [Gaiellaceae bacterium]|nr:hypothetical protein [Gaiellaceae bacterium]